MHRARLLFLSVILLFVAGAHTASPRLSTLALPGPKKLTAIEKDIVGVLYTIDPSSASGSALFDDAIAVPSYSPGNVAALTARLDGDLAAMRKLDWRSWDVDTQIDFRWTYAVAETLRRQLATERLYEHRPAQWLESVSANLINLASYAPERPELQDRVLKMIPAMLDEMRAVATKPTRRDLDTATRLVDALTEMARLRGVTATADALTTYNAELRALKPDREFAVIGAENYAWRLKHTMLLPWTPAELLSKAKADLVFVDARLDGLPPRQPPVPPTAEQQALAKNLTRESKLALYDAVEESLRAATLAGDWVSIPDKVGPILARETPDAMIPLTGDGGSMNPAPTFWKSNISYWNVDHFHADTPEADRLDNVVGAQRYQMGGMGTYAAHEGFPGHHLQLAIARLNPDPLRSILPDGVQNEGWGLYAEEALFLHGGLGYTTDAERTVLGSYRYRMLRVVFDVNIETGVWDLQQGADFRAGGKPGEGKVNEDILRSINWPTQLVWYYSGKQQILALREDYRKKLGDAYTDKKFHDAFLAEGSIPIALIRAKMLGEPVPGID